MSADALQTYEQLIDTNRNQIRDQFQLMAIFTLWCLEGRQFVILAENATRKPTNGWKQINFKQAIPCLHEPTQIRINVMLTGDKTPGKIYVETVGAEGKSKQIIINYAEYMEVDFSENKNIIEVHQRIKFIDLLFDTIAALTNNRIK